MSFIRNVRDKYKVRAMEWPYFHVTNFTGTPNTPNLYLGIRGEKYSTSSYGWDRAKYFWSASLKTGLKLYEPDDDWDLGSFGDAAAKIGFDMNFMETSKDSDISFYQELIEDEDSKYEDLDDLIDQS